MKRFVFLSIVFVAFFLTETSYSKTDWKKERLARWYINYASYLIDVGKYMQALESYETAIEISTYRKTKLDALLGKATLLSTFLDAPDQALKVYRYIKKNFPEAREIAYFREGLLLFSINRRKEAKQVFEEYLKRYPYGRFRFQAEAILREIRKAVPPVKPPVKIVRPKLRVRICKSAKRAYVGGKLLLAESNTILVNGKDLGKRKLIFRSERPIRVSCSGKKKTLRGSVVVKLKRNRLLILNLVDIEEYLFSVVPSESYSSWPMESLKAQAICSRTYAYYQYLHRKDWEYDLVDDEGDQAYKGVERETSRTTKAVKDTEGMVLVYNEKPILAMYTANSGGNTADSGAVFNLPKPYLIAKPDPASLKGKMAVWERRFTRDQIEKAFRRIGIDVRGLRLIEPAQIGPSGRIIKIRVFSRYGIQILRTRTTLKRALNLPEILFKIRRRGDLYIFDGRGWGHGVGYSQWGSAYMGKERSYKEILLFYYPHTQIKKLW